MNLWDREDVKQTQLVFDAYETDAIFREVFFWIKQAIRLDSEEAQKQKKWYYLVNRQTYVWRK